MSKKKSSGIKYNSEGEAYNDLLRLMEAWKKNRKADYTDRGSYLSTLKKEYRSFRICKIIFSNTDIFNILKESQYIEWDLIPEEDLIKLLYYAPKLLKSNDIFHPNYKNNIPNNKITLPILIAYELGKRRHENISATIFFGSGEEIGYPEIFRKNDVRLIHNIADEVTKKIELNESKYFFNTETEENEFFESLISTIREQIELNNSDNEETKDTQTLPITKKDCAVADSDRNIGQSAINEVADKFGNRELISRNDTTNPQEVDRE